MVLSTIGSLETGVGVANLPAYSEYTRFNTNYRSRTPEHFPPSDPSLYSSTVSKIGCWCSYRWIFLLMLLMIVSLIASNLSVYLLMKDACFLESHTATTTGPGRRINFILDPNDYAATQVYAMGHSAPPAVYKKIDAFKKLIHPPKKHTILQFPTEATPIVWRNNYDDDKNSGNSQDYPTYEYSYDKQTVTGGSNIELQHQPQVELVTSQNGGVAGIIEIAAEFQPITVANDQALNERWDLSNFLVPGDRNDEFILPSLTQRNSNGNTQNQVPFAAALASRQSHHDNKNRYSLEFSPPNRTRNSRSIPDKVLHNLVEKSSIETKTWARLPDSVVPLQYDITLKVILDDDIEATDQKYKPFTTHGTVIIKLFCTRPTNTIQLHSADLHINKKSIRMFKDGTVEKSNLLKSHETAETMIILYLVKHLEPNSTYDLSMDFRGRIKNETESGGGLYAYNYLDENQNPRGGTVQKHALVNCTDASGVFCNSDLKIIADDR